MTNLNNLYYVVGILAACTVIAGSVIASIRWLSRRHAETVRMNLQQQQTNKFVRSVATNHLPHIYHAQKEQARATNAILEHLGIEERVELMPDPMIEFVDLEDKGK